MVASFFFDRISADKAWLGDSISIGHFVICWPLLELFLALDLFRERNSFLLVVLISFRRHRLVLMYLVLGGTRRRPLLSFVEDDINVGAAHMLLQLPLALVSVISIRQVIR